MSPTFSSTKRIQIVKPGRAEPKNLLAYHSRDYVDFVLDPRNSDSSISEEEEDINVAEFGLQDVRDSWLDSFLSNAEINQRQLSFTIQDCPTFAGLPEYVQLVAGASLTAAHALKQDKTDIAICWDGGRFFLLQPHMKSN
jgi:histone deacetylase 8